MPPAYPSKTGIAHTGLRPTHRGKPDSRCQIGVDRQGIPLSVLLSAANVYDRVPLEDLNERIPPMCRLRGPPRRSPGRLHADKGRD